MKVFLDESVFGRKCFWTKVFLDEFFSHLDESVPNRFKPTRTKCCGKAMLEAGLEALKECICNVQPLQELAHKATLNFSVDETISAMMVHIGDAIQSTGTTALQDKAAALLGTLLLASDVTRPSGGASTVAEALEELAAFDRHHTGFRLAETQGTFPKSVREFETRVAAEFGSYIHGALPLPLRTFVSISCWVQEPLTQNVQITQKAHVQGAATQVEILG